MSALCPQIASSAATVGHTHSKLPRPLLAVLLWQPPPQPGAGRALWSVTGRLPSTNSIPSNITHLHVTRSHITHSHITHSHVTLTHHTLTHHILTYHTSQSSCLSFSPLLTSPSEWLPDNALASCLSPPPPSHPHQLHLGTSHSLLLLDTRQPGWPLLQESHDLSHTPQIIDTSSMCDRHCINSTA